MGKVQMSDYFSELISWSSFSKLFISKHNIQSPYMFYCWCHVFKIFIDA